MGKRLPWSLVCAVFVFEMFWCLHTWVGQPTIYLVHWVNVDHLYLSPCQRLQTPISNCGWSIVVIVFAHLIESLQRFILIFHCCFVALALELECRGFLHFALTEVPPTLPLIHFAPKSGLAPIFVRNVPILNIFITFQSCDFLLAVIISVVAAHWILTC